MVSNTRTTTTNHAWCACHLPHYIICELNCRKVFFAHQKNRYRWYDCLPSVLGTGYFRQEPTHNYFWLTKVLDNWRSTALVKQCVLGLRPKGKSRTIYRSLIRNQKVDSLCRFAHVNAGCGRVSSLRNGIVHSDPPSVNLHTGALVLGHLRIFVILKIHKTEAPWSARLQQTFTLYSCFRLHIKHYVLNRK